MKKESLDALGAIPVEVEIVPEERGARIMHQGIYRLYEKDDGTLHLVYLPDGADHEEHMEIPGALMQLAKQGAEGKISPMQMMKMVGGMLGGGGLFGG